MSDEPRELRARFHFRVLRNLVIEPDLLGTSHEIKTSEGRAVVTFPTTDTRKLETEDAALPPFPEDDPAPAVVGGMVTTSAAVKPSGALAGVDTLRVDVFVPANGISAAIFRDEELVDWTAPPREASQGLWRSKETAERVLELLLEWVRTEGNQWWLGLAGAPPEGVGRAELVDVAEWTRVPVSINTEPLILRRVSPEQILGSQRPRRLGDRTSEGIAPTLAMSVLADAAYYAHDAEPRDPTRAVLTAAMALELKVKQSLSEGAQGPMRELVKLLFENPRTTRWQRPRSLTSRSVS